MGEVFLVEYAQVALGKNECTITTSSSEDNWVRLVGWSLVEAVAVLNPATREEDSQCQMRVGRITTQLRGWCLQKSTHPSPGDSACGIWVLGHRLKGGGCRAWACHALEAWGKAPAMQVGRQLPAFTNEELVHQL